MPFAGYADFDECVAKNSDRDDPKAYCAVIQRRAEAGRPGNRVGQRMREADEADFEVDISEHTTATPHEHTFGRTAGGGQMPYQKRMAAKRAKFKELLKKSGDVTLSIPGKGPVTMPIGQIKKGKDPMGENIEFTIGNETYNVHPDYMKKAKKGSTVWWGGHKVKESGLSEADEAAVRLELKVSEDPMLRR